MHIFAGRKIDWLQGQPDEWIQKPETQNFLNWLAFREQVHHAEGGGRPTWIDDVAPFLLKEYKNERVYQNPNRDLNEFEHDPHDYSATGLTGHGDTLWDRIPKWAEYLRSREGLANNATAINGFGRGHMDSDFGVRDMDIARENWDEGVAPPESIGDSQDLEDADQKLERRKAWEQTPPEQRDRAHIPEWNPDYDWDSLVEGTIEGGGYYDDKRYAPDHAERVYNHAKMRGEIPQLGEAFQKWREQQEDDHTTNYDGYPPSAEELGLEEPRQDDFFDEEGNYDEDAYDRAYEHFNNEYDEKRDEQMQEDATDYWSNSPEGQAVEGMERHLQPHLDQFTHNYFNEGQPQQSLEGVPATYPYDLRPRPVPDLTQPEPIARWKHPEQRQFLRQEGDQTLPQGFRFTPEQQQQYHDAFVGGHRYGPWEFDYQHDDAAKTFNNYLTDPRYNRAYPQAKPKAQDLLKQWMPQDWIYQSSTLKGRRPKRHLNPNGEPCHCGYGSRKTRDPEHLGHVKESAQIDMLRKRQDLKQHPQREHIFNILQRAYDPQRHDKLFPWMVREFKAGRLALDPVIEARTKRIQDIREAQEKGWPYNTGSPGYPVLKEGEKLDREIQMHQSVIDGHSALGFPSGPGSYAPALSKLNANRIDKWLDWHKQRGQGFSLDQKKPFTEYPNVLNAVGAWEDRERARRRENSGRVEHEFPDGWSIRRIMNADEAEDEGNDMGHCIGGHGYPRLIEEGNPDGGFQYSLRDPKNIPHATIEVRPSAMVHPDHGQVPIDRHDRGDLSFPAEDGYEPILAGGHVVQTQGRSNHTPLTEYKNRINEWLEPHGLHSDEGYDGEEEEEGPEEPEVWWDDSYTVDGADTPQSYIGQLEGGYGEPEAPQDYYNAMADAEEHQADGWNDHHEPDLHYEPPAWDDIVNTLVQPPYLSGRQGPHFDPDLADELYDTANRHGHFDDLMHAGKEWQDQWKHDYPEYQHPNFQWNMDEPEQQAGAWWAKTLREHTNPETQEIEEPGDDGTTAYQRWWDAQMQRFPTLPGMEQQRTMPNFLLDDLGQRTGSYLTTPLYYRWVFNPVSGNVMLDHNAAQHPAFTKTHRDLAGARDSVHGYAYRIGGGYRLTDYAHQPVEDPYIVSQVMHSLRGGGVPAGEDEPVAWDYDKLHYGLPMAAS